MKALRADGGTFQHPRWSSAISCAMASAFSRLACQGNPASCYCGSLREPLPGSCVEGSCVTVQVHRHHPPLVYGRSMSEDPEHSEGAAICRVENSLQGKPVYAAITYR